MRRVLACLFGLAASAAFAAGPKFSLRLESLPWPPFDPQTEERLAIWNSPTGRVQVQVAELQASLGREGLPRPSGALALRLRAQHGLPLRLVAAVQSGGVELSEQAMPVVRWPWEKPEGKPVLPLEKQLSRLLGQRLERH